MKCLLVDDEPGIREGLAALLRRQGHHVDTAADCAAAAQALAGGAFDVVVSDWRLPDGLAATFLGDCACPVIAVSGHPDEVHRAPPIRAVLTKPVAPSTLARAIAAAAAPAASPPAGRLPRDVQDLIDAFTAQLPADANVLVDDDGTFVVVRAEVPAGASVELRSSGGDLRAWHRDGACTYELRACRDGRPACDVPVVRSDAGWPAAAEFAVDFHDSATTPAAFLHCLDAACAARAAGRRVHFLNVPEPLRTYAAGQGRAHDMPMKESVGPRLHAEFADLWSLP